MRWLALAIPFCVGAAFASFGCGDSATTSAPLETDDGGSIDGAGGGPDSGSGDGSTQNDAGDPDAADAAPMKSNIKHVIIVVQENHTFDSYFGSYCTAAAGSSPTCTTGPACCEAAPAKDPSGASPVVLDDSENANYDPNHTASCEASEMNGGAMDRFVTGATCSNAKNFAVAALQGPAKPYHDWAAKYALADRYFQPLVGQSTANDMYFAVAKYVFTDNAYQPNSNGHGCTLPPTPTTTYTNETTIGDVIVNSGHSFAFYAEGYQRMIDAVLCPAAPSDCPAHIPTTPCDYTPSDNPFQFYAQFLDNRTYMKDFAQLADDIAASKLPNVAFVKAVQYKDEHPGYGTTISAGVSFVQGVVDQIESSAYASDTLVLVTWDEGGGFFDHVKPPADSAVDMKPYGTRVPLIAIGRFAKTNTVSHVVMEHSSIVRFLEYNFTGATGQLAARDAVVQGIGSLLDPMQTGIPIP